MPPASGLLLVLDLVGVFAFALNGGLTALRAAKLDVVGVVVLAMITALGGGILRDVLLGDLPPTTFGDWRYLAVAAGSGLLVFLFARGLARVALPIEVLDAAGLSLFAVTGASKALVFGAGWGQAVLLGALTAVGGGTLRDVLVRRVPTVLHSGLYAIPALTAATAVTAAAAFDLSGWWVTVGAAALCFVIRVLGIRFDLNAPTRSFDDLGGASSTRR